jgi:hypothetical protein
MPHSRIFVARPVQIIPNNSAAFQRSDAHIQVHKDSVATYWHLAHLEKKDDNEIFELFLGRLT